MKTKKYILVIIVVILIIYIFSTVTVDKQNKAKFKENILLKNISLDTINNIDVVEKSISQNNSLDVNEIIVRNGNSNTTLEKLLPAGYHSVNIKDSFVFKPNTSKSKYLIFITSWNSENKALETSGVFYDLLIFDKNLKRLSNIENLFFDFEADDAEKEKNNAIRGNKDLVLKKLNEFAEEGKL